MKTYEIKQGMRDATHTVLTFKDTSSTVHNALQFMTRDQRESGLTQAEADAEINECATPGCENLTEPLHARCCGCEEHNCARDCESLTTKQRAALNKAQKRLPVGWELWVSNDGSHFGLTVEGGDVVTGTTKPFDVYCHALGVKGAAYGFAVNRLLASVWHKQVVWDFTLEEQNEGQKLATQDHAL